MRDCFLHLCPTLQEKLKNKEDVMHTLSKCNQFDQPFQNGAQYRVWYTDKNRTMEGFVFLS